MRDGIFNGTPNALAQTSDGYMWIGTSAGLIRFDGMHFEAWKSPEPEFAEPMSVFSLQGARDGSLWIGAGKKVGQLKDGRLHFITEPRLGRVNDLLEDASGAVWLSMTRYRNLPGPLCRIREGSLKCFGIADGFDCRYGNALAKGSDGSVWMASYPGACNRSESKSVAYVPRGMKQGDVSTAVNGIVDRGKAGVLLGFASSGNTLGLQNVIDGVGSSFNVPGLVGSQLKVTAMAMDAKGDVWVGTDGDGIYHVANGRADHFTAADGLSDNQVVRFFEDREGNMWTATAGGLDKFHVLPITTVTTREGLLSNSVQSALALPNGDVMFGSHGGLNLLHNGVFSSYDPHADGVGISANSLFLDSKGTVWVGVDDHLATFSNGHFKRVDLPDGTAPGQIVAVCEDTDHTLWFLTAEKGHRLFHFATGHFQEQPLPVEENARDLAADPVHGIWICDSKNGLIHIDGEHVIHISDKGALFDSLTVARDGGIWAWNAQSLVYRRGNIRAKLDVSNGLPCSRVLSMLNGRRGSVWIYLSCGLIEVQESELKRWVRSPGSSLSTVRLLSVADGARMTAASFSPNATVDTSGQLWFVGDGLLQTVDTRHLALNVLPPPVHIESVTADRVSYAPTGIVHLPKLTRDLTIDYTALSLISPQTVRFRYRLSGVDKSWQDVEDRRQAFYMNLKPGHYTFTVIACNNNGVWNLTGATIDLVLAPAFYQTSWFLTLVVAIVLLLLWLAVRMRVRAATRNAEARQSERMAERDRIARELHDTLIQGVQGLILSVNAAVLRITGNEEPKRELEKVLDHADKLLIEGRNRVRDLRSQTAEATDLLVSLGDLLNEMQPSHEQEITLCISGDVRPLEVLIRDEVLAFAREAVLNAIRHSGASSISCSLSFDHSGLSFECIDNGSGIDAALLAERRSQGHSGLIGMQERATAMHASMTLENSPTGVTVRLRIPAQEAFAQAQSSALAERLRRLWKPTARAIR